MEVPPCIAPFKLTINAMTNNPEKLERKKVIDAYLNAQAQVHAKIQDLVPKYEAMFGERFPVEAYHSSPERMAFRLEECLETGKPAKGLPAGHLT